MSVKTKTQLQAEIDALPDPIDRASFVALIENIKDSFEDYFQSMDTATRDALTPASRMIIFNTDEVRLQLYYSSAWWNIDMSSGSSPLSYLTEVVVKASGNTDYNNPEDDDWRVVVSGENLNFERRESAVWNEKFNMTP